MTEVLLPCPVPWCTDPRPQMGQRGGHLYFVRCTECGTRAPYEHTEDAAVATWNHRAAGQAELVEAATAAIDDVRARYTGTHRSDDDIRFALNTARNAVAAALAPLSQSKGD